MLQLLLYESLGRKPGWRFTARFTFAGVSELVSRAPVPDKYIVKTIFFKKVMRRQEFVFKFTLSCFAIVN